MLRTNLIQTSKLIVLSLVIGLGVSYVGAWTGPTVVPPNCPAGAVGCDAPLHTGTNLQTKSGALWANFFGTTGGGYFGGKLGVGTQAPAAKVDISSAAQADTRILLSGQEFFQSPNTSASGIAFILGVNRVGNRQLWIADSAKLARNSTNQAVRIMIGGANNNARIDAVSTDGTPTQLQVGDIAGVKLVGPLHIPSSGTPGAGKVLTSDATGNATWQSPVGGTSSGDVTKITAGSGISVSPTTGTGNVTISANRVPGTVCGGVAIYRAVDNTGGYHDYKYKVWGNCVTGITNDMTLTGANTGGCVAPAVRRVVHTTDVYNGGSVITRSHYPAESFMCIY